MARRRVICVSEQNLFAPGRSLVVLLSRRSQILSLQGLVQDTLCLRRSQRRAALGDETKNCASVVVKRDGACLHARSRGDRETQFESAPTVQLRANIVDAVVSRATCRGVV